MQTKHKIYNYSYVGNVDLMMDAADCVITKPGGLTVSEAMAKSLPLLVTKPIPGQEERNLDFLLNFGCAMRISKTLPIDEIVSQFFWDGKKVENLKKNMDLIRKPDSVADLYEHISALVGQK
jgi:processive 1,2-diacylglycerol beta-glucosyltransferase